MKDRNLKIPETLMATQVTSGHFFSTSSPNFTNWNSYSRCHHGSFSALNF